MRSRIWCWMADVCAARRAERCWTGAFMERKVSAMISRRCMASLTSDAGPQAAIQEAFICGRPQTLADAAEDEGEAAGFAGGEAGLGRSARA